MLKKKRHPNVPRTIPRDRTIWGEKKALSIRQSKKRKKKPQRKEKIDSPGGGEGFLTLTPGDSISIRAEAKIWHEEFECVFFPRGGAPEKKRLSLEERAGKRVGEKKAKRDLYEKGMVSGRRKDQKNQPSTIEKNIHQCFLDLGGELVRLF